MIVKRQSLLKEFVHFDREKKRLSSLSNKRKQDKLVIIYNEEKGSDTGRMMETKPLVNRIKVKDLLQIHVDDTLLSVDQ